MAKDAPITPMYEGSAKALFSSGQWNKALKSAILSAGRNWITNRLPLRFSKYAITDLWYVANKMNRRDVGIGIDIRQISTIRSMMREDGTRAKIVSAACAEWGGWDPTGHHHAPAQVWHDWIVSQRQQGIDWRGRWKDARAAMRKYVREKSRMDELLNNYARENAEKYLGGVVPLVKTGELKSYATSHARAEAAAKNTQLVLRIPRPGKKYAPVVNLVLGRLGKGEAAQVQADVSAYMDAFVAGSTAGKKGTRKATGAQIESQKIIMARERSTVKYRPRKAANHKDRT